MFKVGQKVWCVMFDEGVVRNILATDTRFPLVVEFDGKLECYTLDGKYVLNTAQVLFPHPIEITKKIVKPSINWEHVDSKFNYLAEDANGDAFLYEKEPLITMTAFGNRGGEIAEVHMFASYVKGICGWKDSLVKRPEGDNHDN